MIRFGFKVSQAKGLFFDRPAVMRSMDRKTRYVLASFGGLVRTTSRRSIRRRKSDSSQPGSPPFSKTGLLRDHIYFAAEPSRRNVVIGPAKLNKPGDVPALLETGGSVTRRVFAIEKGGKTELRSSRKAPPKRVAYEPRPYMKPAMDKSLPKLDGLWQQSVRRFG